jgi:drug/metabolite transporter (DMT)-like permease
MLRQNVVTSASQKKVMSEKENIKAYIALFSIYIIWGTTYLAIRIGVEDLPPVLFAGLRWLIAGPFLLVILKLRGYKVPKTKDLINIGVAGFCLLAVGNGFVVFSEQYISSGLAALLITTVPFWIVGMESILPKGLRINGIVLLGLILGLAGIIIIFGGDVQLLLDLENLGGVIGILIAVIGWSAGTVYTKYKKIDIHPLMGASVQMIIAGIILSTFGLILGEGSSFHFTQESFWAFVYLIVMGSLLGYGSYIYAIAHLPISLVSTYAYVNPIIALFLGWWILDEKISTSIIIAAFIILGGVALVKKGTDKTKINS